MEGSFLKKKQKTPKWNPRVTTLTTTRKANTEGGNSLKTEKEITPANKPSHRKAKLRNGHPQRKKKKFPKTKKGERENPLSPPTNPKGGRGKKVWQQRKQRRDSRKGNESKTSQKSWGGAIGIQRVMKAAANTAAHKRWNQKNHELITKKKGGERRQGEKHVGGEKKRTPTKTSTYHLKRRTNKGKKQRKKGVE